MLPFLGWFGGIFIEHSKRMAVYIHCIVREIPTMIVHVAPSWMISERTFKLIMLIVIIKHTLESKFGVNGFCGFEFFV